MKKNSGNNKNDEDEARKRTLYLNIDLYNEKKIHDILPP